MSDKPPTAKDEILRRLREAGRPLAVHELGLVGYNENSLATRLSELAGKRKVVGRIRKGARFKEWSLPPEHGEQPSFADVVGDMVGALEARR